MQRLPQLSLLVICSALSSTASITAYAKATTAPIRQEMGGLFAVTSTLLPLVLDKAAFEDKKNEAAIFKQMSQLKSLSHIMATQSSRFSDSDPSIQFVSERFSEDVDYAIQMWNNGDRVIPRRLLKHVTDYCISCHTRTSKGAHFHSAVQPASFKSLPTLTRAEYFAATRQYDEALKIYERVLVNQPLSKMDPMAWNESAQKMLAITVRVQKKPSVTLELISSLQDKPHSVPDHMTVQLSEWRKAAKAWVAEKPAQPTTDAERLLLIKKLMDEGESIAALVPGGGLIQFLRASSLLHEILGRVKSGDQYQELLWLAGQSANALKEFNLWSMQDIYFESCARNGRDKVLKEKCLTAFEDSALLSYGARTRGDLPPFIQRRLKLLRENK